MSLKLKRPTNAENTTINAGIARDPDNPEWTERDFANARAATDAIPQLVRRRGGQKAPTKELVSLRLDRDVLDRLRAGGIGWQSQVNATLRTALGLPAPIRRG